MPKCQGGCDATHLKLLHLRSEAAGYFWGPYALAGPSLKTWKVPLPAGYRSHKPGCSADLTSGSEGKYQQNKMPENRGATRPCFNLHAQWKECKIAQTLAQTS